MSLFGSMDYDPQKTAQQAPHAESWSCGLDGGHGYTGVLHWLGTGTGGMGHQKTGGSAVDDVPALEVANRMQLPCPPLLVCDLQFGLQLDVPAACQMAPLIS